MRLANVLFVLLVFFFCLFFSICLHWNVYLETTCFKYVACSASSLAQRSVLAGCLIMYSGRCLHNTSTFILLMKLWVGDLLKLSDLKARKSVLNGTVLKRRLDLEKTSVLLPSSGSDGNNILTADSFIDRKVNLTYIY